MKQNNNFLSSGQKAAYVQEASKWARGKVRPQSAKCTKRQQDASFSYQQSTIGTQGARSHSKKSGSRPITAISRTVQKVPPTSEKKVSANNMSAERIPRSLAKDREQLYEEMLEIKKKFNDSRSEVTRLKTQVAQYERELSRKDQHIKELLERATARNGQIGRIKTDTHLISALKKRVKELSNINLSKNKEILTIRRSVKHTKFNEVEAELKMYVDECERLRKLLEEQQCRGSGASELPVSQPTEQDRGADTIKKLRSEAQELISAVQKKEEDLTEWKDKAQKLEKQTKDLSKERDEIRKSSEGIIKGLKEEIKKLKTTRGGESLEQMKKANLDLAKQVKSREEQIEALEEQCERAEKELDGKSAYETELKLLRGRLKEYERSSKKASPAKPVPIISEADVLSPATELRLFLILREVAPKNAKQGLFDKYSPEDKITINELHKHLCGLVKPKREDDFMKLARYAIEPRERNEIEYSETCAASIEQILRRLRPLLQDYIVFTEAAEKETQEALVAKLTGRMDSLIRTLQSIETEPDFISCECVDQLNKILSLKLSAPERDYVILVMFKQGRDLRRLPFQELIKKLELLGCKGESPVESEKKLLELELPPEQENEAKFDKKIPRKKVSSEPNEPAMLESEEQLIEVAQKIFLQIAERMAEEKTTLRRLFHDSITKRKVEGEEIEVVSHEAFFEGLKKLGIKELQPLETQCLIRVLAVNEKEEEEEWISVDNLAQILEDYGVVEQSSGEDNNRDREEKVAEGKSASGFLNFESLDDVSMVLLLALAEYLIQAKVPLYELFGKHVYTQTVTTKTKQRTVELVDSANFFAVLREIGINLEDAEHENLKEFLCLDQKYKEKLYMKKLKKAIEEFAFNEELRTVARKCYEELAEQDDEEGAENDEAAEKPEEVEAEDDNGGNQTL